MHETGLRLALHKLRTRLRWWRVVAVVAITALLALSFARTTGLVVSGGERIARIRIDGFIVGRQRMLDLIERLAKNDDVRAVIMRINSPGGTTAGSEALYRALRRLAKRKPLVAVMDSVAASGGYLVALAADRIFAEHNTITGSIGVIVQWPELHELLARLGVRMQVVRSGPLKALPNTFEPTPPEARKVTEALVRDSYHWFVALLARRRRLSSEVARELADGRIYSGAQAEKLGLIDALGDEIDARRWLEAKRGIAFTTPVVAYRPRRSWLEELGVSGLVGLVRLLGVDAAARQLFAAPGRVDGLLSVWHPALVWGTK